MSTPGSESERRIGDTATLLTKYGKRRDNKLLDIKVHEISWCQIYIPDDPWCLYKSPRMSWFILTNLRPAVNRQLLFLRKGHVELVDDSRPTYEITKNQRNHKHCEDPIRQCETSHVRKSDIHQKHMPRSQCDDSHWPREQVSRQRLASLSLRTGPESCGVLTKLLSNVILSKICNYHQDSVT